MGEIKFRVWDGKTMLEFPDIREWDIEDYSDFHKACEDGGKVCQFIGLKDKIGKDICEGDILELSQWEYAKKHYKPLPKKKECEGIYIVQLEVGHWGLHCNWENISGYPCSTHIMGDKDKNGFMEQVKVIGNIYENPELLK